MRISSIHGFVAKSRYNAVRNQSNPISAPNYPKGLNQLNADTVSFRHAEETAEVTPDIQRTPDDYLESLKESFVTETAVNDDGENELLTFDLNIGHGKARFFGYEDGLAEYASNKKLRDFEAKSDDKKNYLYYKDGRYEYTLTYSRDEGKLLKGRIEYGNMSEHTYKSFTLAASKKMPGKYVGHYEYQNVEDERVSKEDTKILFSDDMNIEKCAVTKNTEYCTIDA